MDIIEIKHGKGTFIKNNPSKALGKDIWKSWLTVNKEDVIILLEVREVLETKSIELSNIFCEDWEDLEDELSEILRNMEQALNNDDIEQVANLDILFHEKLSCLADSDLLTSLIKEINKVISNERKSVFSIPSRASISTDEHKNILLGVKNKDKEEIIKHLTKHLKSVKKQIKNYNF